jgi:sulfur carrier protein ThiS
VQITAILFGTYARLLPPSDQGRATLDVPAGSTVEDVLDALAVPAQERTFLTLDGERVAPEKPLHEGAELRIIVPLGGG